MSRKRDEWKHLNGEKGFKWGHEERYRHDSQFDQDKSGDDVDDPWSANPKVSSIWLRYRDWIPPRQHGPLEIVFESGFISYGFHGNFTDKIVKLTFPVFVFSTQAVTQCILLISCIKHYRWFEETRINNYMNRLQLMVFVLENS